MQLVFIETKEKIAMEKGLKLKARAQAIAVMVLWIGIIILIWRAI